MVRAELERLIAGRAFTKAHIDAVRGAIMRGEIDTITHAASGGIALALEIIKAYEQEQKRPRS